jgi:hypothetical protein
VKNQKTLILTALVTLAVIFATTMSFGVAFATTENNQDQDNDQICILSDCIQINQENDEGDNNVGDVTSNDEIEEGEIQEDAQTLIATPY